MDGGSVIAPAADYRAFLHRKAQEGSDHGFDPVWLPDFLYGFQAAVVAWNLRKGRSAAFADCGLGKTPMQLVFAENVVRHTGGRALIVAPLGVAWQTVKEAQKFGIEATRSLDGTAYPGITVTNYERLHHFNPRDFRGMVLDESSILKNFDGALRSLITEFLRQVEYRLACTATAAPNDYIELGTHSDALGYLGHTDMLGRFFRNQANTVDTRGKWRGFGAPHAFARQQWRFKAHAQQPFWRWVCSWARALRKPSDLGFPDTGFELPPLIRREHQVRARRLAPGMLFEAPAVGLREEREEQRRTLVERCETAATLVADTGQPAILWCNLNAEGDLLEKLLPEARQVSGSQSPEEKEDAYSEFAEGGRRLLIVKPKCAAFGLNWQHCAHMTIFPTHSYEQAYQQVRRCWRFGQTRPVVVDSVVTEGGAEVARNLVRKEAAAAQMFSELVRYMNDAMGIDRSREYPLKEELPSWLS